MDNTMKTMCADPGDEDCFVLHMEERTIFSNAMFLFQLFQSGLIFTALVAGLVSLTHVIYCRTTKCRNSSSISALLLVGFCHMITCVYLLQMSEEAVEAEDLRATGQGGCLDYFLPATLANTAVLVILIHNVIKYSSSTKIGAALTWIISLGSMLTGVSFIVNSSSDMVPTMAQQSLVTLGDTNHTHLDVFWSVCQKALSNERDRLILEYVLIYTPVIIVIITAWYRSRRESKGSLLNMKVILNDSCDCKWEVCDCTRLNPALIAILVYSAVILLLARPLLILYARSTSEHFRDVLPSLLHTVTYCFICSEYISKIILKQHSMRLYPGQSKSILYV